MRNKYGVSVASKKPWEQDYGDDWDALRKLVYQRDGYKCRKCSASVRGDPQRACHHIIPRSRGGPNAMHNLLTICGACHRKEHKHLEHSHRTSNQPQPRKQIPFYRRYR